MAHSHINVGTVLPYSSGRVQGQDMFYSIVEIRSNKVGDNEWLKADRCEYLADLGRIVIIDLIVIFAAKSVYKHGVIPCGSFGNEFLGSVESCEQVYIERSGG